jgi:nitrogen regulatory protein PII
MQSGTKDGNHKLITCILPIGVAHSVVQTLKNEKQFVTANVSNARGLGKQTDLKHRRLGDQTEKQILTVVVPDDQADEIFEFIYHEAHIDRPHGGLVFMSNLDRATPFVLPDLPEEE